MTVDWTKFVPVIVGLLVAAFGGIDLETTGRLGLDRELVFISFGIGLAAGVAAPMVPKAVSSASALLRPKSTN